MNKKGFTLVELLATIVILTILSLITIPLILGIIDKAKQSAFEDSVKISSRQVEMYLFENGLSEIPSDGIKVKNMDLKSDFISGTFKNEDGKIIADKIRNKEFCASGPINRLVIRKDCDELDITAPVIDESKLILSKTSNSVTVNILDGFAIEEESYIKNYTINIYDNNQKIDSKTINDIGTVKFTGLTSNKEYKIEVIATNSNDLTASATKTITTTEIETPTYVVSPSGWAQSKTVAITYPSGYTNEYSTDSGLTWKKYTTAILFTGNGSVIARVTDGVNTTSAAAQAITGIDTTAPTSATFAYTRTSNSISVTASGTDSESGITHYQFSKDNGKNWTPVQTSNKYTFDNLTTNTYSVKVKVINGTYANVKAINTNNSLDSEAKEVATTSITAPTYSVTPSGWARSKTVTITYPTGYTNEYSLDGGQSWKTYTSALTFNANGSVIARATDGTNKVTASAQSVTGIDNDKPTAASFTYTKTSNSIKIKATGTDKTSNIVKYQFSKDNGATWSSVQSSNEYEFTGLKSNTYIVKVKVYDQADNSLESTSQSIDTIVIATPTYSVTPNGWAQSKTVTITYPSGYTNEYSLDGGQSWKTYTSALTFNANGSVIARSSDGTNTITASSQSVTQIDTTKPTAASFTTTNTSNSITITATGTDAESGISHYQFSKDDGKNWSTIQSSNKYIFSNLTTGSYSIKVKVINGTYANVKAVNANNSLDSSAKAVSTTTIATPTYIVSPSGWAQSKTVTINYASGYTNEYSTDGGKTWKAYSKALTFTANGSVIARIRDGVNTITASSQSVTGIDTTKPTSSSFTTTTTSNSITVTAAGTDGESGITHYQFSKDNGSTWTTIQTSNKYTFSSLKTGSYTIMVKVINGTYANVKAVNANNSLNSASKAVSTTTITTPIYAVSPTGWAQSKTVTITYPSGYTNQYSTDGGKTWIAYSKALTFNANGSVIARTTDGTNTVTASSQSVTGIDTTKPTAASFTTTKTSKSITVTATGTDAESGITHYQFSKDNGKNWTTVQTGKSYTFNNLKAGSYSIKVKVINGTYANVKTVNANNSLDSTAQTVTTTSIATPTYTVSPSGWAQSKTVTINYASGYTNEYSTDGGKTWKAYSKALTFTANGSVIARIRDGINTVTASSQSVTQIDTTKPTAASFTYTRTSKSITVTASGTDAESGITHYQFSKDNGTTWTTIQTGKSYTFNNLATGSYNIKVKVINGTYANVKAVNANNSLDSTAQSVATVAIAAPTYSVTNASTWALSKTVTITYPSGYTNQYSLDSGATWKTYTAPIVLTDLGKTSAIVIARVTDGKNYKNGSTLTVSNIYLTSADKVTFTPSDSNWKVTNVHEALEYLRNN